MSLGHPGWNTSSAIGDPANSQATKGYDGRSHIVVGCVETSERSDGLLDHGFDLAVIGYVASNRECLVPACRHLLRGRSYGLFIRVGQRHRGARLGKSFRRRKTQSRSGARERATLSSNDMFTSNLPSGLRVSCG
jgi:hypothetical protein